MKIIYLLVVFSFIFIQPVVAVLAPSWEQKTIIVDHFDQEGRMVARDGTVFEISSPEIKKQVRAYKKQAVRVLYTSMGGRYIVSEFKPATEPPFVVPTLTVKKKTAPE